MKILMKIIQKLWWLVIFADSGWDKSMQEREYKLNNYCWIQKRKRYVPFTNNLALKPSESKRI